MLTPELICAACAVDTPTICNALELVMGSRSSTGFTYGTLIAAPAPLTPVLGFARTAQVRAMSPSTLTPEESKKRRLEYFRYVAGSQEVPTIVVMQDVDPRPGTGSFWGEVNSAVHEGLGVSGVLTNGSVRDLGDLSPTLPILAGSIGPSHAFVHLVSFGQPVDVFDLTVAHDDLLHADRHGAVKIPMECLPELVRCIELTRRKEVPLLAAARAPGFTVADIERAMLESDDIH